MPYHARLDIRPILPKPLESEGIWIKGDMVNAVGFHRLDLVRIGRSEEGKRQYYYNLLNNGQMELVQRCVLHGMGLSSLTKHV